MRLIVRPVTLCENTVRKYLALQRQLGANTWSSGHVEQDLNGSLRNTVLKNTVLKINSLFGENIVDVEHNDVSFFGFNRFQKIPTNKLGLKFGLFYFGGGDADTSIDDTNDLKALADVASLHLERYENIGAPFEDKYIDEMTNYDTEDRRQQVAGQSSSSVSGAFGEAINAELKSKAAGGINPNSGAFKTAINEGHMAEAGAKSDNVNRSLQSLQDAEMQGKQNVIAMGRGQQTEAIQGLNSMAIDSTQRAKDTAFRNHNTNSANSEALGMAAGMATRTALGADDE